jgi:hypothetical protein
MNIEIWIRKRDFLGTVMHTCNSSTQEVEAGGSRVQDQFGLLSKTPSHTHIHTHTKRDQNISV